MQPQSLRASLWGWSSFWWSFLCAKHMFSFEIMAENHYSHSVGRLEGFCPVLSAVPVVLYFLHLLIIDNIYPVLWKFFVTLSWLVFYNDEISYLLCKLIFFQKQLYFIWVTLIDGRWIPISIWYCFECDCLILSTATFPVIKGSAQLCNQVIVYFHVSFFFL